MEYQALNLSRVLTAVAYATITLVAQLAAG